MYVCMYECVSLYVCYVCYVCMHIGKTLIGKAIAYQVGATFFSISSSSLTSKWIGEGEKTVRTLFAVAAYRQPSVVFIDEVDSLLCQRSAEENEASRRMKTEFMVQLDGAGTNLSAHVTIVGATNRPDELDDAVRRRFVKRIYIPLPDDAGRRQLVDNLLSGNRHCLQQSDIDWLVGRTQGFSGADIRSLCTEAALCPMREVAISLGNNLQKLQLTDVPSITRSHFEEALQCVTSSVSSVDLQRYIDWNSVYGSFRRLE
jgi:SpoVK/Ycf46/Vps4 family AAA+-type ATPase